MANQESAVCPLVFETPPPQGAPLPLNELSTCVPSVMPDKDGKFEEQICRDKRLSRYERSMIFKSFGKQIRNMCRKRSVEEQNSQTSSEANRSAFQKRFAGQLIKSHDRGQSAIETCNSMNSIGPNFYSYHEKQFCDMETRKLFPRCENADETECFDE